MKKENTAIRLKKIMEERGLRQVDILNLAKPYCKEYNVKMNKSDISQYCSGKTEPNSPKLFVLGKALNVDEAWLMGLDTIVERTNVNNRIGRFTTLSHYYGLLSDINKNKVDEYAKKLYEIESVEQELFAAHERTDIEVTNEMIQHDIDIMNDENF